MEKQKRMRLAVSVALSMPVNVCVLWGLLKLQLEVSPVFVWLSIRMRCYGY